MPDRDNFQVKSVKGKHLTFDPTSTLALGMAHLYAGWGRLGVGWDVDVHLHTNMTPRYHFFSWLRPGAEVGWDGCDSDDGDDDDDDDDDDDYDVDGDYNERNDGDDDGYDDEYGDDHDDNDDHDDDEYDYYYNDDDYVYNIYFYYDDDEDDDDDDDDDDDEDDDFRVNSRIHIGVTSEQM